MTFEKLKTLDLFRRIPDEGMMIAVLEGRILVERYRKEVDGLYFPDAEEEKTMEPDLLFVDEMLLRPEYRSDHVGIQKLKVMNRYRYTDFDTMTLDNYRISW